MLLEPFKNASSGRTGWIIAEYLHRIGHNVICIAGKTSANPSFFPSERVSGWNSRWYAEIMQGNSH